MEIHINFLRECANYFEKKVAGAKEDSEHWAYRQNAENLRKAADAFAAAHQHIQLHAGDCLSLDNEVNLMRSHWEAEMAENAALKTELEKRQQELSKAYRCISDLDISEARLKAEVAEARAKAMKECAKIARSHSRVPRGEIVSLYQRAAHDIYDKIRQASRSLSTSQGEQENG